MGGNSGGDFERALAGRCAFQLAAALHIDGALVGQVAVGVEGKSLRDGQSFVLVDGEVVL